MDTEGGTERGHESETIEKSGRKALFLGVPCKSLLIDEEKEDRDNARILELESKVAEYENVKMDQETRLLSLSLLRESIFGRNPMPLLMLDPSRKIVDVNEAFSRVSGISPDDLKLMGFEDFRIVSQKGGGISDALKFKRHNVSEITVELPSGIHTFEQYSIPIISRQGDVNSVLLILQDITAIEEEKQQLRDEIDGLKSRLAEEIEIKAAVDQANKSLQAPTSEVPVVAANIIEKKELELLKSTEESRIFDVVEFELGGEKYALDINLAREIVEMMPITHIPCSPDYLRGIMNLRGEITNIINITRILGLSGRDENSGNKIIILSADATGGQNIGVIVDDVQSVIQVRESDIEHFSEGLGSQSQGHIKGIIKIAKGTDKKGESMGEKDLVIWIDMLKVIGDLTQQKPK